MCVFSVELKGPSIRLIPSFRVDTSRGIDAILKLGVS